MRALVVDYGGVLTNPISETISEFLRQHNRTVAQLLEALSRSSRRAGETIMAALERAEISENEFLDVMNSELSFEPALSLADFRDSWFSGRRGNTPMVEEVAAVHHRGFTTGLLTNNVREWEEHWTGVVGDMSIFDVVVDSSLERVRKPEPEIYRRLLDRMDAAADEILFVDDDRENCRVAETFGISVHRFESTPVAVATIREWFDGHG